MLKAILSHCNSISPKTKHINLATSFGAEDHDYTDLFTLDYVYFSHIFST